MYSRIQWLLCMIELCIKPFRDPLSPEPKQDPVCYQPVMKEKSTPDPPILFSLLFCFFFFGTPPPHLIIKISSRSLFFLIFRSQFHFAFIVDFTPAHLWLISSFLYFFPFTKDYQEKCADFSRGLYCSAGIT